MSTTFFFLKSYDSPCMRVRFFRQFQEFSCLRKSATELTDTLNHVLHHGMYSNLVYKRFSFSHTFEPWRQKKIEEIFWKWINYRRLQYSSSIDFHQFSHVFFQSDPFFKFALNLIGNFKHLILGRVAIHKCNLIFGYLVK